MNQEEFIVTCNQSPIFKKDGILVAKKILQNTHFDKSAYQLSDMPKLKELLYFTSPKQFLNTSKNYNKQSREHKDLQHLYRLDFKKNKDIIRQLRKNLRMPHVYTGMTSSNLTNSGSYAFMGSDPYLWRE